MSSQEAGILICDVELSQDQIHEIKEKFSPLSLHFCKPSLASQTICDTKIPLLSAYINPLCPAPGAFDLLYEIVTHRPNLPIYWVDNGTKHFQDAELRRLGGARNLAWSQIQKLTPAQISEAIEWNAQSASIPVPPMLREEDQQYVPIPALHLILLEQTPFELYLKLPSGKYHLIHEPSERLQHERVRNYIERGAHFFYIKKIAWNRQRIYLRLLKFVFLKSVGISTELKTFERLNPGAKLLELIQNNGVDVQTILESEEYVCSVFDQVKHLIAQKEQPTLLRLLHSMHHYQHAISSVFFTALFAHALKVESSNAFRNIGLAAFFHGIGLLDMPDHFQNETTDTLNAEELTLYRTHPITGAEKLESTGQFDSTVLQAVAQHHERNDGSGFPMGKMERDINKIAELIGLADLMIQNMSQNKMDLKDSYKKIRESELQKFSYEVAKAFENTFSKLILD